MNTTMEDLLVREDWESISVNENYNLNLLLCYCWDF